MLITSKKLLFRRVYNQKNHASGFTKRSIKDRINFRINIITSAYLILFTAILLILTLSFIVDETVIEYKWFWEMIDADTKFLLLPIYQKKEL